MDENTVVMNDAIETETPQADVVVVDEQPTELVESQPQTEAQADTVSKLFTKKEVDEMVRRKAEFMKRGMENDPLYQVARAFASHMGGDPKEAAKKLMEENIDRRAKELASNPEELAKTFLRERMPQQPQEDDTQQKATRIAAEIKNLGDTGQLPSGFNLENFVRADPDFLRNVEEFGAKAAIKIASSSVNPNKNLPQSTRPASNAQPAPVDYTKMSSKEFMEHREKMLKKARGW